MKTRTITALIALPFLILPIYLGGIWITIICFLLSIFGAYELFKAYKIHNKGIVFLTMLVITTYYILLEFFDNMYFTGLIVFFLFSLLILYVISFPKISFSDVSIALMTFFYPTYLISHIGLMSKFSPVGGVFIWLVFIIGFGSDTFAYIAGRTLGKRKLAKNLSPNKTVEGFIGGIIGGVTLTILYVAIMASQNALPSNYNIYYFIAIGAIGSVLSVFGDLTASAIKRQTGIKDFGSLLPGHGGILDRFDSNIFTAPFVYYTMVLWVNLYG